MSESKMAELFEKAPVSQAVLKNALPAMAAMLMVLIYNLADTFFIGQTHDDLQVAAVSLAMPVFLMFMAAGTVFGMGGTSVISRALGEGNREYARKVCAFCMWSCIIVGTAMSALFLIFMDQILALVGASADTWVYAKTYLSIVSLGGPFTVISNCYSNVIRAEGNSGQAMMGQLLGNLLNVILDPTISVELDAEQAPKTVENFLSLARSGFYDGLTFHRIMEGFMIQGGDPNGDGTGGSETNITGEFSLNEVENTISHVRGVISMARSSAYDSAGSQFFIVHEDSTFLDGQYAAFGHVTDGMEAVDAIAADAQPTDDNGTIPAEAQPVISSVKVID